MQHTMTITAQWDAVDHCNTTCRGEHLFMLRQMYSYLQIWSLVTIFRIWDLTFGKRSSYELQHNCRCCFRRRIIIMFSFQVKNLSSFKLGTTDLTLWASMLLQCSYSLFLQPLYPESRLEGQLARFKFWTDDKKIDTSDQTLASFHAARDWR
jgi:hypothetical protein